LLLDDRRGNDFIKRARTTQRVEAGFPPIPHKRVIGPGLRKLESGNVSGIDHVAGFRTCQIRFHHRPDLGYHR
jgi:hypothetical protein